MLNIIAKELLISSFYKLIYSFLKFSNLICMKIKLNNWFFYLLILIQLQLDLLLFKYNLCGLFALLVFLFIFNKKQVWICNLFTFLAFMLMQFIINTNLIQLALAQVVISFFDLGIFNIA